MPDKPRLGLVPLDDRPVSLSQVRLLAACAGYDLLTPPLALLGHRTTPGACERLGGWLERRAGQAQGWIVSLDMLAYGGLVASRTLAAPLEACLARVDRLRRVKRRWPRLPIYGFQAIRRLAGTVDTSKDLAAWRRAHLSGGPADERRRNHFVNSRAVDLAARGSLDWLSLLQEDASTSGPHKAEQRALARLVAERGVSDRVHITTGTDEASMILLARLILRLKGLRARLRPVYSSARGARRVALYEDRPIEATVRGQLAALGAASAADAATGLHVWCPDMPSADLAMGEAAPARPARVKVELARFVDGIARSLSAGRKVVVADVALGNGADSELADALSRRVPLAALSGYAAWNTAANTIGCAAAQAALALDDKRFLAMRLVEDWGYQAATRPRLERWARRTLRADPWRLTPAQKRRVESRLNVELRAWSRRALAAHFPKDQVAGAARLPWSRLFEVETWHTS